jgi:hypothetical protein
MPITKLLHPKKAKAAKGTRQPKFKADGRLEIVDAFSVRLISVDEVNETAVLAISIVGETETQVHLNADPPDMFYGTVKIEL